MEGDACHRVQKLSGYAKGRQLRPGGSSPTRSIVKGEPMSAEDQEKQAAKSPTQTQVPSPQQAGVEPSGPKGDNPATAGPGQTGVRSKTSENALGHLNPSAPEDSNTTPGTTGKK